MAIHAYACRPYRVRPASLACSLKGLTAHPALLFYRAQPSVSIACDFRASLLRRTLTHGRPVSASVTPVRSAFVPHCAFPAPRSLRPGGSGVGIAAWPPCPDPPGGILPPGLVMRRHSLSGRSLQRFFTGAWRLPCRRFATTSCSPGAQRSGCRSRVRGIQCGGHSSRKLRMGIPAIAALLRDPPGLWIATNRRHLREASLQRRCTPMHRVVNSFQRDLGPILVACSSVALRDCREKPSFCGLRAPIFSENRNTLPADNRSDVPNQAL